MGFVFENKQSFCERTKYLVDRGVVQKKSERWTNDLDCLEKYLKTDEKIIKQSDQIFRKILEKRLFLF